MPRNCTLVSKSGVMREMQQIERGHLFNETSTCCCEASAMTFREDKQQRNKKYRDQVLQLRFRSNFFRSLLVREARVTILSATIFPGLFHAATSYIRIGILAFTHVGANPGNRVLETASRAAPHELRIRFVVT